MATNVSRYRRKLWKGSSRLHEDEAWHCQGEGAQEGEGSTKGP
jgi:hypothetical protein